MSDAIYPHHLFIAACQEATGVCGEVYLYLYRTMGKDFMDTINKNCSKKNEMIHTLETGINVSDSTVTVLDEARRTMKYYNQSLINEGHIIKAILKKKDEALHEILSEKIKSNIIEIACTPRDLIAPLVGYDWIIQELSAAYNVRRANYSDLNHLTKFIESEFGERWLTHVGYAFSNLSEIPIYIAEKNGNIIGFACFDIVRGKKGLFGPMGTSQNDRTKGIGKALLYRCLVDMKKIGYEYAIIGQAGPIEFYERACKAALVPR